MTRDEARAAGETRYQGAPCFRGHDGIRAVNNSQCITCKIQHRAVRSAKEAGKPVPLEPRKKTKAVLPVAYSEGIRPITREQLMGRR